MPEFNNEEISTIALLYAYQVDFVMQQLLLQGELDFWIILLKGLQKMMRTLFYDIYQVDLVLPAPAIAAPTYAQIKKEA